jgi:transcription initiation factor TFIID subunit 2
MFLLLLEDKPMMLAIEFCLEKPQGGVRFMRKRPFDKTSPSDCYLCTVDHNACYWFPCVNSLNEVCTWKIEVLVEKDFTVVASGNLVEVETLTQLLPVSIPTLNTEFDPMPPPALPKSISMKKYHYFMSVPTCPANIGLVVGQFDSMIDENLPEVTYYFDSMLKPLVKDTCSFMSELFDFYEDVLSVSFPFASHKQVFLPDLAEDYITFSTLTVIKYVLYFHFG